MAKVMLVNGSPHKNGTTARALDELQRVLEEEGVEVGRFWIGTKPIAGCIACGYCGEHDGQCVFKDVVNEFNGIARDYDGFIFGTPVYYASAAGQIRSFMDRSFYSQAHGSESIYALKPAAAISAARRGGNTSAFDELNKYFSILQMFIITATYWNMVYGTTPEEAEQDEEGLRTMRVLAHNMAYFLRMKEAADEAGVELPPLEAPARTNFVR